MERIPKQARFRIDCRNSPGDNQHAEDVRLRVHRQDKAARQEHDCDQRHPYSEPHGSSDTAITRHIAAQSGQDPPKCADRDVVPVDPERVPKNPTEPKKSANDQPRDHQPETDTCLKLFRGARINDDSTIMKRGVRPGFLAMVRSRKTSTRNSKVIAAVTMPPHLPCLRRVALGADRASHKMIACSLVRRFRSQARLRRNETNLPSQGQHPRPLQ